MCGIAGILYPDGAERDAPQLGAIRAMTERLRHRGPDGEGYYRGVGVELGHRRLNVIDIAGGAQPMANEDETVWVTYNGEVYNFVALRRELTARGHRFRTRCDTEVVVHGYEEWGDAVVDRLSGMFAFGLWDARRRRALLARDRMGQKPLFFAHLADGRLLFGSEAKALVAHPDLEPSVDLGALAAYLTYEYVPSGQCIFAGVDSLPPGYVLAYQAGEIALRRYWDLPFGSERPPARAGQAERHFRRLFEASVRRRLVADVPLGVFLSGGIDSSAVAATAVSLRPPGSVKTFSIGFREPSFDESKVARRVARHLGTDHHERIFGANDLIELLPEVVEALDEPFGDASLLPTYLLSKFTREAVTVALGGDGGDELLMGYPTFQADGAARLYRRLPKGLRRFLAVQLSGLPVDTRNFSRDFVIKSFLRAADAPPAQRHPFWLGSFIPDSADDPLRGDWRREYPLERVVEPAVRAYHQAGDDARLQRLSYQYCKTYLAGDILVKVDRASMAVSLEARSPFLDPDVVAFLVNLKPSSKLWLGWRSKHILRRAFRRVLPKEVLRRPKKGFGIPVAEWFKGPLREHLLELLDGRRLKRAGFFEASVVERLVAEHLRGRRDNRKLLWTLFVFELFRDRYGITSA